MQGAHPSKSTSSLLPKTTVPSAEPARASRMRMVLIVGLIITTVQILLISVFINLDSASVAANHMIPQAATNEDFSVCEVDGLQGHLREDSLLTVIFSTKSLGPKTFNSGGQRHLVYALEAKRRLNRINFVLMSEHCEILRLAQKVGVATVRPQSGTDAGDLSYNHAFELIAKVANSPIVGFANSDIMFLDTLIPTLETVIEWWREGQYRDIFLTGVRTNIDVDDSVMQIEENGNVTDSSWNTFREYVSDEKNGELFLRNTADYFFWNRNTTIDWVKLPPFLMGGRAFDNWMVAYTNGKKEIETVDLTESTRAAHVNHGKSVWTSHYSIASKFNGLVFDKEGMKGSPNTRHCNWETYIDDEGVYQIRTLVANKK